ncbi:hypothetical protein niasHT_007609 [Heterodera trifolii]|uniref:Exportin-1/Importin-beta-like domain-containing protein n=1 Tax=Heterodera trifolii TaxID=157864 RepID=A0ABD2LQ06_9BILA
MINIDSEVLARNVTEFYNATSEIRRMELQKILDQFLETPYAWNVAISLVTAPNPTNVQFYGAKLLHNTISRHFDIVAEDAENISALKDFYIQTLTVGAGSLSHSVINKLSSGLAVLMLKSLPDIWPSPIRDLMLLWSNQLELLLRVIAEIAVEFYRLNVSLDQRNAVKSELNNTEISVIQISQHVLEDADSSPSIRNAAIECIELWLKLPGAKLETYLGAFDGIFANIGNDFPPLTRILLTIKSIEGLAQMPKLIWQITQFVARDVCPRVQTELNSLLSLNQQHNHSSDGMNELVPLVCAIAEFGHDFMFCILKIVCNNIENQNIVNVFISLCQFFFNVSTLPGTFPIDECLSELGEPWWCSLREHLLMADDGSTWNTGRQQLRNEISKLYLEMLRVIIDKFTFIPDRMKNFDKESLERFEAYRTERNDVSLNAIQLEPEQTVQLLAHSLEHSLDIFDQNRSEAILHLINEAADFINDSHLPPLLSALRKLVPVDIWLSRGVSHYDDGFQRYVRTLLTLLQTMDHLLHSSSDGQALLPHIVHTVLSCLSLSDCSALKPGIDEMALGTLTAMLKNKESAIRNRIDAIDTIIQKCYDHFSNERRNSNSRLSAIRCVGIALSFKQPEFILTSLNQILAPRLIELDSLASNFTFSGQQQDKVLFELGILAQLVATLEPKYLHADATQMNGSVILPSVVNDSPVRLIIDQTLPLFNKLLSNNNETPSEKLISMLCDVLKSTVHSLYTQSAPLLDTILNFVDVIISAHPRPACELAKSLFLTFHKNRDETTTKLIAHLAKWFADELAFLQQLSTFDAIDAEERVEQLLTLGYYVLKKFWDNLLFVSSTLTTTNQMEAGILCCAFVRHFCLIIATVLQHSKNPSLVQLGLRSLFHLLTKCNSVDDCPPLSDTIGSIAGQLTSAVFVSIRSELVTGNINVVADILHALASKYPNVTRSTVLALSGGDSQRLNALFARPNKFDFRQICATMHQTALLQKDPAI